MTPAGSYTETDFKETEIGLIPADWETASFDMSILSGKANVGKLNSSEFKTVGRYPIVDQGQQFIAGYTDEENLVFQGSLPVIVFGDHTRVFKYIDFPFVCGADGVKVLQPNASLFNPLFLFFALASLRIPNKGYNRHYKLLQEEKIPLPPLPEQRRIADALNAIQDDIAAQDDILSEARAFKRSLMERLFTYGPGEHPAETKETEIGEIPAHWEVDTIGSITESSAFGPRFSGDLYDDLGNVATLRTTDLDDYGHISYSTMPRAQLSLDRYQNHLLQLNDLLITRSGTCGIAAVFDSFDLPVLPGAFLIRFRLNHEVRPVFVRNYINSSAGRPRILQLAGGAVQQNLSSTSLKTFLIPIPPLNEQEEIDDLIADTDAKIAVEEDRKAALQEVFQSALHQLMSGQVRLVG